MRRTWVLALGWMLVTAHGGMVAPRWTRVGLSAGGTLYPVGWSPHDPATLTMASDMGCAFVTRDGGLTWRPTATNAAPWEARRGGRITRLYVDPDLPDRLFAGTTERLQGQGPDGWRRPLPLG